MRRTGGATVKSKIILVTGASSGLGRAMAGHLAAAGHTVFGTSRRPASTAGAVRMLVLDLTDDASVAAAVQAVLTAAGRIDVLINNAGSGLCGAVEDTSLEEARWQMETNFFGPVRMIRAVLPHMRRQGGGRIITVSSLAGLAALPYQPYYSASKFALEGLNEALRLELSGSAIDCTTINPGDFATGFTSARVLAAASDSPAHGARLRRTLAIYERDERGGADPRLVAALAARLVEARRVGVRNTVGNRLQRFGMVLKRLLPATWFEGIMRLTYETR
jgi:NAD(P)-dependent dehydrogenase (short-subunit alcohol dehydrogenase family)